MHRIVRSVANETEGGLTTVERVKLELSITGSAHDNLLALKIAEATSDIETRIRPIRHAAVVEEFWPGVGRLGPPAPIIGVEAFNVSRYPIESVASILVDGDTIDSAEYRIDEKSGTIYRLDGSGSPSSWTVGKLASVTYTGGYIFPDDTGYSLPPVLESAAIELISLFWFARGRDPLLKAEENPGVARFEYWVGAVGPQGDLPPSVMGKLSAFLRPPVFA